MVDDLYTVAGTDLSAFVADWLALVEAESQNYTGALPGALPGLLDDAVSQREGYQFGAMYLLSQVAPSVVGEKGSREQLLLYAVLATFQGARFPGVDLNHWEGVQVHVERAFTYMHQVGEAAAAQGLRASVAEAAQPDDGSENVLREFKERYWSTRTAGDRAAHEQLMAEGSMRDLRAATALDPEGEFTL